MGATTDPTSTADVATELEEFEDEAVDVAVLGLLVPAMIVLTNSSLVLLLCLLLLLRSFVPFFA